MVSDEERLTRQPRSEVSGDVAERVERALSRHPAIDSVRLVGSRARGDPTPFSDWDFEITTHRFRSVARVLPSPVRPLRPLARQWDRLSRHWTYMLLLEGPRKVDLLFGGSHEKEKPWMVNRKALPQIDDHFWDWVLWLLSKEAGGRPEVVRLELDTMFEHILEPIGVRQRPVGIDVAVAAYREARAKQEHVYQVGVSRRLEHEVLKAFQRPRRAVSGNLPASPSGPDLKDPAASPVRLVGPSGSASSSRSPQ